MADTMEACQGCGAAVSKATSFLSDKGVLCPACFGQWEVQQRAAEVENAAKEKVRMHRAGVLGWYHGVNWGTALILLAGWSSVPRWLISFLVFAVLGLGYALSFRSHTAFLVALALDTVGSLVFLVASACLVVWDIRLVFLIIPVGFALRFARLTWRERETFTKQPRL